MCQWEAIQQEGKTVNNHIYILFVQLYSSHFLVFVLYYVNQRQQRKITAEREAEREQYNQQLKEALHARS